MAKVTAPKTQEELEALILENASKWQISKAPLATLSDAQLDVIYQIGDCIKSEYYEEDSKADNAQTSSTTSEAIPTVTTNHDYVQWLIRAESSLRHENLTEYTRYHEAVSKQADECKKLFADADSTVDALEELRLRYQEVTTKTDSLHNLSEELMKSQKELKETKKSISEKLHHFVAFNHLYNNVERNSKRINCSEYLSILDDIDNAIEYLNNHMMYKESKIYKIKYESLLATALAYLCENVNNVIIEATKQITDPENSTALLNVESTHSEPVVVESAFSLYYGKFQNAASKVDTALKHIEAKVDLHNHYKNTVYDCQKTYFVQRSPIMSSAVQKALSDLKERHKNDYSVLFRSSCLFVMKVCQDESMCFYYFFSKPSEQLSDYLGILCQYLYDNLRPTLITINHLEVLTELCGILRKEILNEYFDNNDSLERYVDTIRQMLQDVEERLVFRSHVFFHHDLSSYKPSPGDLAYPEKLEQLENIALELNESRTDSRASVVSMESQEVANINASQLAQFRSYTGNSPADLHGMWYPTVKRTLVCLSRLYFCLDKETFQGLAQEALAICTQTIENAASQIITRKSVVDGKLFQIKHLLIIREQIAPFQVDFTVKEVALDFSNVKNAAVGLINNRNKLFTFNSNNALLEFLLEGTPRVKEYLIDSRKEIDKHLKISCESFINHITLVLVGNVLSWLRRADQLLKTTPKAENEVLLSEQEFGKPIVVAGILSVAQRNIKSKIPEIQRSMQLYLSNRETEFILFRPIKNNIINAFIQVEQMLMAAKYTPEEQVVIACPSPEQVNVLICSVSLAMEQDTFGRISRSRRISQMSVQQEDDAESNTGNVSESVPST